MQIIDTIVTREGENNAWATVVFLGAQGETISVRLACPVPTGGSAGRAYIVKRAAEMLRRLISSEGFATLGEQIWAMPTGRFGAAPDTPAAPGLSWRGDQIGGEE